MHSVSEQPTRLLGIGYSSDHGSMKLSRASTSATPPSNRASNLRTQNSTHSTTSSRQQARPSKRGKDPSQLGWLLSEKVITSFPSELSRVCPLFTFVDNQCTSANCPKQHLYYCELSKEKKDIAATYVAKTKGLHFNNDLKTCGTPAKPRRFKV